MSDPALERRVHRLENQMERFIADVESEKETRKRMTTHQDTRFDKLDDNQRRTERILYIGIGILLVVEVLVVPLMIAWITSK